MVNPILLIAIPLFVAFSVPIVERIYKKAIPILVLFTLLFDFIGIVTILEHAISRPILVIIGGWTPPWGINLSVDALGAFFAFIILLVALVVYIYIYYRGLYPSPFEKFNMLYLLVVMGSIGMVLTGDIFNMFVFLEITAIASYGLAGIRGDGKGSEGAFKYLVLGSISSSFVLIGIMFLYGNIGTLNIAHIAQNIGKINPYVLGVAFTMFLIGFGTEAEFFPLNAWVPDTYTGAPHFVTALFSGMVSKAGIYALIRLFYILFGFTHFSWILMIFAFLTMFMAELSALTQTDFKRLLSYSSIGQMGLATLGFGVGSYLGVVGGLFQLFSHALSKAVLFLSLGYLTGLLKSRRISGIEGLAKKMPWFAFVMSIAIFSILGFPPFLGFWGKFYLVLAFIEARPAYLIFIIVILLVTLVEGYYYLRIVHKFYFAPPKRDTVVLEKKEDFRVVALMLVLVGIIFLLGIYPKAILVYIKPAAKALLNKAAYINFVLKGGL